MCNESQDDKELCLHPGACGGFDPHNDTCIWS